MTLIIRFYFLSLSDFLNELKFNHQVNKNTSTVVRVLSIQWHLNNKYIRTDRTSVLRTEGLGLIIECYLALEHIKKYWFRNDVVSCRPDFFIYGNVTTQLVECLTHSLVRHIILNVGLL